MVSANGAASRGPWPPPRGCAWQRRRSTRRTHEHFWNDGMYFGTRFSLEVFCHFDPSFLLWMYFCDENAMGA